jgi:hypothetical protein
LINPKKQKINPEQIPTIKKSNSKPPLRQDHHEESGHLHMNSSQKYWQHQVSSEPFAGNVWNFGH